jgi:hypothetical protein
MMKRSLLFLALVAVVVFASQASKAATLVVDDDGAGSVADCNAATAAYPTISLAVAAASNGDTIKVCPGTYADNVVVNKSLRIRGAQAGNFYGGRTFAGPNESTVTGITPFVGVFSVEASNVTIDGFSVSNPGRTLGIGVKTPGDNALLTNNIIDTIGGTAVNDTTVGIYLEYGPDRVRVLLNRIRNIVSVRSAQGVLIGDSTSANPSLNILVALNRIEDITSTRGAYGIQVNNGSSTATTATGYTTVAVLCNTINNLKGGWAHAIGLEGDTPGAIVSGNSISNLVDLTPVLFNDAIAVFFQDNPSFSTGHVNLNNFDLTAADYGIAVDPTLRNPAGNPAGTLSGGPVDGTRNWWGNSSGPGPVGPGTGAKVTPLVRYTPWLRSRASVCGNGNDNDTDHHDNDDGDDHDDDGDHDN